MGRRVVLLLPLVSLVGCPRRPPPPRSAEPAPASARPSAAGAATYVDWYPEDISLPPGVEYPCAVTALPAELSGVPEEDRGYLNHACALVIGVVREKQTLLTTLGRREDGSADLAAYLEVSAEARRRLHAEPVPAGLETFHEHVLAALDLHRTFFEQAVVRGAQGASMKELHQLPEGRSASRLLMAAWGELDRRYGSSWSAAVKDSVYHHLCALDLF